MNGHTVWRVRVSPGERTCCECGETFPDDAMCPRCGLNDDGSRRVPPQPSVPTLSYLREGEYER